MRHGVFAVYFIWLVLVPYRRFVVLNVAHTVPVSFDNAHPTRIIINDVIALFDILLLLEEVDVLHEVGFHLRFDDVLCQSASGGVHARGRELLVERVDEAVGLRDLELRCLHFLLELGGLQLPRLRTLVGLAHLGLGGLKKRVLFLKLLLHLGVLVQEGAVLERQAGELTLQIGELAVDVRLVILDVDVAIDTDAVAERPRCAGHGCLGLGERRLQLGARGHELLVFLLQLKHLSV